MGLDLRLKKEKRGGGTFFFPLLLLLAFFLLLRPLPLLLPIRPLLQTSKPYYFFFLFAIFYLPILMPTIKTHHKIKHTIK